MTVRVVDGFEVIDIAVENGDRISLSRTQQRSQFVEECRTIQCTRERVVPCPEFQEPACLSNLVDVDNLRDKEARLTFGAPNERDLQFDPHEVTVTAAVTLLESIARDQSIKQPLKVI